MISKCASKIVQRLIRTGVIGEDDRELYIYGFFVLLSYVFSFGITLIAGLLFSVPFESATLYIMFAILRGYAGGFHSKSEARCSLYTVIALSLSSLCIRLLYLVDKPFIAIVILCCGTALVVPLCPIDSQEKPLTSEEYLHYRMASYITLGIICLLGFGTFAFQEYGVLYASALSVLLESILLIMGKCNANR